MKINTPKKIYYGLLLSLFCCYYVSCSRMSGMPKNIVLEPRDTIELRKLTTDSVTLIATKRFDAGLIKPIFQGRNYRKAWSTPITVPTLDLATYEGGLTPIEQGGGMQTLSMDLRGKDGVVYTLRSVNKNPEAAVPNFLRKIKFEDLVMDAMSAQHPYGAIVVAELADAIGIQHTHPKLFYVPAQESLDTFNETFRDKIFLLEYEPEGTGSWIPLENVRKIVNTEKVQKMLKKNPDSKIDDRALIRVRLFDLMIGDWDRHAKQWGWVVTKKDDQVTYIPLPTDRDNAFYNPEGLIPWFATRSFMTPFIRPFRKKIGYMPGLIKPFDRFFLIDTPVEVFEEVAKELQEDLTDEEIENAFRKWPQQFYDIDAKKMIKRIKARREKLLEYARKFKKHIDKKGKPTEPLKGSSEVY